MSAVLTMILVFLIAGAVFVVSAVGFGNRSSSTSQGPAVRRVKRAAEHLNGDAEAPSAIVRLLG